MPVVLTKVAAEKAHVVLGSMSPVSGPREAAVHLQQSSSDYPHQSPSHLSTQVNTQPVTLFHHHHHLGSYN